MLAIEQLTQSLQSIPNYFLPEVHIEPLAQVNHDIVHLGERVIYLRNVGSSAMIAWFGFDLVKDAKAFIKDANFAFYHVAKAEIKRTTTRTGCKVEVMIEGELEIARIEGAAQKLFNWKPDTDKNDADDNFQIGSEFIDALIVGSEVALSSPVEPKIFLEIHNNEIDVIAFSQYRIFVCTVPFYGVQKNKTIAISPENIKLLEEYKNSFRVSISPKTVAFSGNGKRMSIPFSEETPQKMASLLQKAKDPEGKYWAICPTQEIRELLNNYSSQSDLVEAKFNFNKSQVTFKSGDSSSSQTFRIQSSAQSDLDPDPITFKISDLLKALKSFGSENHFQIFIDNDENKWWHLHLTSIASIASISWIIAAVIVVEQPASSQSESQPESQPTKPQPTIDHQIVAALRKVADNLEQKIQEKLNPAIASQRPTARRMRIAEQIRKEGESLQKMQSLAYSLAAAHETRKIPECCKFIKQKRTLEILCDLGQTGKWENIGDKDTKNLEKAGIYDNNLEKVLNYLSSLDTPTPDPSPEQIAIQKERELVGSKIPGYFPTPPELADKLVEVADLRPGESVLEPSAGSGNIVRAIAKAHPDAQISAIEINPTLYSILELWSEVHHFNLVDRNFFSHHQEYDVIIQNPPFEKMADINHVYHAYKLTKRRLVSIMSPSPFFRNDKKAVQFREWFDKVGGKKYDLPDGSFKSSGTGVKAVYIVIDR